MWVWVWFIYLDYRLYSSISFHVEVCGLQKGVLGKKGAKFIYEES
jgi:hypothetical protein